ncbi:MAG: Gmad2 immunoglobulin-like domain-containing protein, partial [Lachnospiraceae bacterium]|nr:Gmad2 immunoglobulin-like domain-containing protein [Lachnospiraceae bacterium]
MQNENRMKICIPKWKIITAVILILMTLFYLYKIHDNENYNVHGGNLTRSAMADIGDGEIVTQTFEVQENNFRSLWVFLSKSEAFEGNVTLELRDQEDALVAQTTLSADKLAEGEGAYCELAFSKEIDSLGSVYTLSVFVSENDSGDSLYIGIDT